MNMVPIKITIYGPDDCAVKDKQELLDRRIKRISSETYAQGALITQADIAILLEESTKTISQHITSLEKKGELMPTRGKMEGHRSWDKPQEKKLWSFTSKVMNILRSKERQNIVAKPSCAM
jgi:SOS-response transcriptional repressor LexA